MTEKGEAVGEASGMRLPAEFRMTRQRREVFEVLTGSLDHPTATDVFVRVKERMPSISLATVYNCLETLTTCGLINQVNLDRSPSRFCANRAEHVHFHCEDCGKVVDADPRRSLNPADFWNLPEGVMVTDLSVAIRGKCPDCAAAAAAAGAGAEDGGSGRGIKTGASGKA